MASTLDPLQAGLDAINTYKQKSRNRDPKVLPNVIFPLREVMHFLVLYDLNSETLFFEYPFCDRNNTEIKFCISKLNRFGFNFPLCAYFDVYEQTSFDLN